KIVIPGIHFRSVGIPERLNGQVALKTRSTKWNRGLGFCLRIEDILANGDAVVPVHLVNRMPEIDRRLSDQAAAFALIKFGRPARGEDIVFLPLVGTKPPRRKTL